MSSETERPIEKQLRELAAKRAAAPPKDAFDLHPVTRNVLKVEVDRVFGRPAPLTGSPGWWEFLWPRLAMASGAMALVAVLIISLMPSPPVETEQRMAMTEKRPDPASVSAPQSKSNVDSVADSFTPPRPALPVNVSAAPTPGRLVYQFYNERPQASPANTAARRIATAPASPSPRTAERMADASTVAAPTTPSATPTQFLDQFQVRLSGDQIEIVDLDQSSYRGRIQLIDPNTVAGFADALAKADLGDANDPAFPKKYRLYSERASGSAPAALQFTVTGTNRTTRQTVEFTGRMLTWTQATPATASTAPASLLQIQGNATFGGNPPQSVNATTQPR